MKARAQGEHTSGLAMGRSHLERYFGTSERQRHALPEKQTRHGCGFSFWETGNRSVRDKEDFTMAGMLGISGRVTWEVPSGGPSNPHHVPHPENAPPLTEGPV